MKIVRCHDYQYIHQLEHLTQSSKLRSVSFLLQVIDLKFLSIVYRNIQKKKEKPHYIPTRKNKAVNKRERNNIIRAKNFDLPIKANRFLQSKINLLCFIKLMSNNFLRSRPFSPDHLLPGTTIAISDHHILHDATEKTQRWKATRAECQGLVRQYL